MNSNSFDLCFRVNPHDSVPEALSKVIEYLIDNKFLSEGDLATVSKTGKYVDLIDKPTSFPNPYPVTINGQRYDGSEEVTITINGGGSGTHVDIDGTLTQSGKAADAKVVGDRLNIINEEIEAQNTEIAKKVNDSDIAKVAKSGSYNDLTGKPTIPTVPSTLPNPNALTFTGAVNETYDGRAAKSVAIPTVPESLKNPNKLIFTGAVTSEYDGSTQVSVEIPAGGSGSYTLPVASPTTLGGVQPAAKTDEMTQAVGVDDAGGLWTMAGGGSTEGTSVVDTLMDITTTEEVSYVYQELSEEHEYSSFRLISDVKCSANNTGTRHLCLYCVYQDGGKTYEPIIGMAYSPSTADSDKWADMISFLGVRQTLCISAIYNNQQVGPFNMANHAMMRFTGVPNGAKIKAINVETQNKMNLFGVGTHIVVEGVRR